MSETVSFLGGAAIAGLAAIVLVRGTGPSYSNPPAPQVSPAPTVAPSPPPAPVPSPVATSPLPCATASPQDEARKNEVDTLKLQAEQQKLEIEKLKLQIQKQDGLIQTVTTQARSGVSQPGVDPSQGALATSNQPLPIAPASQNEMMNPVLTGMLWVAGGLASCLIGGGLILGVLAMFARQQPRRIPPVYYYPVESERSTQRTRYVEPIREQPLPKRARHKTYD